MAGNGDSGPPPLRLLSSAGSRLDGAVVLSIELLGQKYIPDNRNLSAFRGKKLYSFQYACGEVSVKGSRELTGALDLVTHYGLQDIFEHFCRNPLQVSIADSPYIKQVVGQNEFRKGEGMELGQIRAGSAESSNQVFSIQTFDLQVLQWAFTLRETGVIELPEDDKGLGTVCGNSKDDKDKKHRKKHKRHKHRDKEKEDKDAENDAVKGEYEEDHTKKHRKKKRKQTEQQQDGDGHKHKKKKHKHSSKVEGLGVVKSRK